MASSDTVGIHFYSSVLVAALLLRGWFGFFLLSRMVELVSSVAVSVVAQK